jgi:hypothetical protein
MRTCYLVLSQLYKCKGFCIIQYCTGTCKGVENGSKPLIFYGALSVPRAGMYVSPPISTWTPEVFYTLFFNHAHRLRLEKLLYLELSRSSNGFFQVLLDPGGGFTSETTARRLQKRNGRYETVSVSEVKRL